MPLGQPRFDVSVPQNGYRWWYLDAVSDDGGHGLTVIAFIGSVFSPYYAWSRRRGPAEPANFCAINVALYGRDRRWCMTERGRGALARDGARFAVGQSALAWIGGTLNVEVNEIAVPLPRRVSGKIRLTPIALGDHVEQLDARGEHFWRPIAPLAAIEVAFDSPRIAWRGTGYHDMNWGASPLEDSFKEWTWSRAPLKDGACVLYDIERRDGSAKSLALRFDRQGGVEPAALPPRADLGKAFWRMPRVTRSEGAASVVSALEDAPFYTRSLIASQLFGEEVVGVHESLSLDRFRLPIVQAMLPFRMPRRQ